MWPRIFEDEIAKKVVSRHDDRRGAQAMASIPSHGFTAPKHERWPMSCVRRSSKYAGALPHERSPAAARWLMER
jgi:hypothetical protein